MLFGPCVRFCDFGSVRVTEWPPIGRIAACSAYDMFSWYKYLSVILVFFPPLGLWSGNFFPIAQFPEHCLLVTFLVIKVISVLKHYLRVY